MNMNTTTATNMMTRQSNYRICQNPMIPCSLEERKKRNKGSVPEISYLGHAYVILACEFSVKSIKLSNTRNEFYIKCDDGDYLPHNI